MVFKKKKKKKKIVILISNHLKFQLFRFKAHLKSKSFYDILL